MIASFVTILCAFVAGFAAAQNSSSGGSYPYVVNPGSIDFQTRNSWCMGQLQSCPQICGGVASPNTCDADTLQYVCTCTDGSTPNITQYSTTLPFFECQAYKSQCVQQTNDAMAQAACNNIPCGSKSPAVALSSASAAAASSMMATASSSSSASATSTSAPAATTSSSSSNKNAASSIDASQSYGLGAFILGGLLLFGRAL